jgi:hypothetical protein
LSFAPGEAYQFDWSHETITFQGLPLTIKAVRIPTQGGQVFRADGGHPTGLMAATIPN